MPLRKHMLVRVDAHVARAQAHRHVQHDAHKRCVGRQRCDHALKLVVRRVAEPASRDQQVNTWTYAFPSPFLFFLFKVK
jgi:hypothetical protein